MDKKEIKERRYGMDELIKKVESVSARMEIVEGLPDKFEQLIKEISEFRGESSADRKSIKSLIAATNAEVKRINGTLRNTTERVAIAETCIVSIQDAIETVSDAVEKVTNWRDNIRTLVAVMLGIGLVVGIVLGFLGKLILQV